MNKLSKIFKNKKIVIGALHFAPLFGYKDFSNLNDVLKNALYDLEAFQKGGVDAIIFENNYDVPHKELVNPETISAMTYLCSELKKKTRLPLGVSVLWNDYRSALSIAKTLDFQFIRVPVFVDKVMTSYGIFSPNAKEVIKFRRYLDAVDIALITDIHVKHAKLLTRNSIVESAKLAIKNGSDGLIITGRWTGDSPDIRELTGVRNAIGNFPIIIGSGANENNIEELLQYANGVIVSTSLKRGSSNKKETNVKTFRQRIDVNKVRKFISKV